jgi:hypothetical protein
MLLERHGGFDDLEHPGLVTDADAPGLRRRLDEFTQLAQAPVGLQIARGNDRNQNRDTGQAIHQAIREDVIALEFWVPPDLRRSPQQLPETDLQGPVKARNPPLLALDESHIINMGVTDENVVLETHAGGTSL